MFAKAKRFVLDHKLYCVYVPLFWLVFIVLILLSVKGREIIPFFYRVV